MTVKSGLRNFIKIMVQSLAPHMAVKRATTNNPHEEPEVDLLPALVMSNRIAIDVGGHLGSYTKRLMPLVPKVIVFEANPRLAAVLRSVFKNATVRSEAVSDTKGVTKLQIPLVDGASVDGLASLEQQSDQSVQLVEVKTITLDEFTNTDVGFLKIDVEGHELNVLKGARSMLTTQRPTVLVEAEERHRKGTIVDLFKFFDDIDYIGVFVFGTDILPISEFRYEMQDPTFDFSEYRRQDAVFANNFIFFPRERWTAESRLKLETLRQKTAPKSAPSSGAVIARLFGNAAPTGAPL